MTIVYKTLYTLCALYVYNVSEHTMVVNTCPLYTTIVYKMLYTLCALYVYNVYNVL